MGENLRCKDDWGVTPTVHCVGTGGKLSGSQRFTVYVNVRTWVGSMLPMIYTIRANVFGEKWPVPVALCFTNHNATATRRTLCRLMYCICNIMPCPPSCLMLPRFHLKLKEVFPLWSLVMLRYVALPKSNLSTAVEVSYLFETSKLIAVSNLPVFKTIHRNAQLDVSIFSQYQFPWLCWFKLVVHWYWSWVWFDFHVTWKSLITVITFLVGRILFIDRKRVDFKIRCLYNDKFRSIHVVPLQKNLPLERSTSWQSILFAGVHQFLGKGVRNWFSTSTIQKAAYGSAP